jgi:hypothetical protein
VPKMRRLRTLVRNIADTPFLRMELLRWSRRPRLYVIRGAILTILLLVLLVVYRLQSQATPKKMTLNERASLGERYVVALLVLQNVAILVLGILLATSSFREEKNSRIMELLLTSQLSEAEIYCGNALAIIALLGGPLLVCLPVITLLQLWSGVDFTFLAVNYVNSAFNLISVCACCSLVALGHSQVLSIFGLLLGVANALLLLPLTFSGFSISFFLIPFSNSTPKAGLALFWLLHVGVWLWLAWICKKELSLWRRKLLEGENKEEVVILNDTERADVGDDALHWKETEWKKNTLPAEPFIVAPLMVIAAAVYAAAHNQMFGQLFIPARFSSDLFKALIILVCGCYGCMITLSLATSFAVEREKKTLDSLLILPLTRLDLLAAVWKGAFERRRGWLYFFDGVVVLGIVVSAIHPLSLFMILLSAASQIAFWAALGLYLSLCSQTQQGAFVRLGCFAMLLIGLPFVLNWTRTPATQSFWLDLAEFGVSPLTAWPASCFGWQEEFPPWPVAYGLFAGSILMGGVALLLWWLARRRLEWSE